MKLLTKNTDYAIRALMVLGKERGGYISSRDISDKEKIPYQYVRKILQRLIQKGYIESKEGGKGGVRSKGSPDKIKVIDLIKLFQGEVQFSECMFRDRVCHNRKTCVLRSNIQKIEKVVIKEFKGITIGSLLKEEMKGEG
ncbi:MAG: Rrf2 family transcriptional regulator [Candidatus Omnitrophota bacterium]